VFNSSYLVNTLYFEALSLGYGYYLDFIFHINTAAIMLFFITLDLFKIAYLKKKEIDVFYRS